MSENSQDFKPGEWQKDWEGNFSILINDMSTPPYIHESLRLLGTNVDKVLVLRRNGVASCFLHRNGVEAFSKDLLAHVEANPAICDMWGTETVKEYEQLAQLMALPIEQLLEPKNMQELVKHVRNYAAYLGAIKTIGRVLNTSQLETVGKPLAEARLRTESFFFNLNDVINSFTGYIAKKEEYAPELIRSLTTDELIEYLEGKALPSQDMLARRSEKSAFLYSDTILELPYESVNEIEQAIYGTNDTTLAGTTAYPGVVTARACVIVDFAKQKGDFQEGDVLVTSMTEPKYMPLMKNASAIVADTGGVLCHAAIVSRELHIPCVIGTERATRLINTGDTIEVDADTGIVRIVSTL